jgi:hypothetical protein
LISREILIAAISALRTDCLRVKISHENAEHAVNPPGAGQAAVVGGSRSPQRSEPSDAFKDINILLLGSGRLQITAEVNKEGLAALRKMLDKYEEILDLLATPTDQIKRLQGGHDEEG